MGALTGVSSGPLTAILRIIKIHLKPYQREAQHDEEEVNDEEHDEEVLDSAPP